LDAIPDFEPLRKTVIGASGTEKNFIIYSIVNVVIRKLGYNKVVHVAAPTVTTAFNVQGETIHRFSEIDWKNSNK
jgi:hypothetical protein